MKPEIKAQWLTALRSGDYHQGQGYLREGDHYCCLGVLCDLYSKAVGPEWKAADDGVHAMHETDTMLPIKVGEWADLMSASAMDLVAMNDSGSTFEELANIIERNL